MDTNQQLNDTAARIARSNDVARGNVCNYVLTRGVVSLDPTVVSDIFERVQNFKDFTDDNDPYGEHDFCSFDVSEHKLFWKIDYYDEYLEKWCDPLSPDCNRVLTILLAEEY